jgi:receptor expression-enhancing protein 5/6
MFGALSRVAVALVGLAYPSYLSFKAVESPAKTDDVQWLTYWTVYAFIGFFEQIAKEFLAYVPLYDELKVLFLLWLWMPQFKGATFIYDHYLAPWFKTNAKTLDSYASLGESKLNQAVSPEAHAQLNQYVQQHGFEALQSFLQKPR